MSRLRIFIAAGVAAALVAAAGSSAATPKLVAKVGPDSSFKITLTKGGKKVTKLKPGKYKIAVSDTASTHDFHLFGPGVNKKTSVAGKASTTWTVTLKKGKYTYQCDPHALAGMKGTFTVG
jgi:plastocyanin